MPAGRGVRGSSRQWRAADGSELRTHAPATASTAVEQLGESFKSLLAVLETQAVGKEGRCGRPQASYATKDSITLSWRFPADAIGKHICTHIHKHARFLI